MHSLELHKSIKTLVGDSTDHVDACKMAPLGGYKVLEMTASLDSHQIPLVRNSYATGANELGRHSSY